MTDINGVELKIGDIICYRNTAANIYFNDGFGRIIRFIDNFCGEQTVLINPPNSCEQYKFLFNVELCPETIAMLYMLEN